MINVIVPTSPQVSNYNASVPILEGLRSSIDRMPNTSLPTEVPGTVQANTSPLPPVSLYNAHGILVKDKSPNSLISYA
jgi:hypothetical protein